MAVDKKKFYVKPEIRDDETIIEGFDIEIDKDDVERIDRLVNDYEKRIMSHLDEVYSSTTSRPDRWADKIAQFGGSWPFIIWFGSFLAAWVIWNSLSFTRHFHFDGPPFILLNLCLSFIAAFQAPIIMMSQNRQAARDKNEALIDFAINYKAEQEIDDMQRHLHQIEGELIEIKQLLRAANRRQGVTEESSPTQ
ncbi:DUF1003 domain-containing protein [Alicyclobacillus cycloheptanicus]|uniref:Membrane protein n=1 Tax=Alicyclobacillus cycloheptanicus TaxID=1457 RepID=A0ABT9XJN2_9BACL|nr:DUF1003 domain-containing protein [Alicyclobacillus cycloheptanicus]MDQ0189993.1 putative membrane protein [Alicyclobacillus cycloheptanicus]WDM00098.1 DUF1003 domain-containing protein [Alicyclobacillus cycloheptanicus]